MGSFTPKDVLLLILSLFLPPLAVFIKRGLHADFWINIVLTLLGWFPGLIHAWWVIYAREGSAF